MFRVSLLKEIKLHIKFKLVLIEAMLTVKVNVENMEVKKDEYNLNVLPS